MLLPKAELTPSGRPKLVPGEVERVLLDKVDIEFEESGSTEGSPPDKAYKGGYCVVTSHRLLWIDAAATPSPGRSCHMPLDSIHTVHKRVQYSLNLMNPKVRLEVQLFVDRHFKPTNRQLSATFRYLNLRCRGEAPDSFQEHLSAALSAHRLMLEQQAAKQGQQQQQQQAALQQQSQQPYPQQQQQQQQQQQAAPWSTSSDLVSHPISGALASGSFSVPPPGQGMWLDTQQQQQPSSGGGGGLPPRSPLQGAPSPLGGRGLQAVDGELLSQLTDMGFPRPRVVRALLATHNEHLQAALDWILAAGEEPGLDAPLPVPEPAVVTKQELQRLQQYNMLQQQGGSQGAQGPRGQEQLLNPGWGMGSVSAAAALGGGAGAGSSVGYGAAGGYPGQPGGSWSAVGPLTAGMGGPPGSSGSGSSPRKGSPGPSGGMAAAAGGPGSSWVGAGPSQSGPSSRMVGVAGIMTREAERNSQTAANLAAAFQDLDNLMSMAAEMVKLAEKFRGVMGTDGSITLNPSSGSSGSLSALGLTPPSAGGAVGSGGGGGPDSSGGSSSSSEQLLLDAETQLQLIAMGITSPVTRASAGARYHQELARQLADFLAGPLAKAGGVMMLPDVYCLFNRARGTELVSPDDLLQACDAFPQVGLPLRLRKFPSGVTVVQGAQFSDKQLCANIEQLLRRKSQAGPGAVSTLSSSSSSFIAGLGPGLSATDVSAALLLPLTLAKEALLVAEASGVLCRDDGPEGLRFFRNFFREATPVAF